MGGHKYKGLKFHANGELWQKIVGREWITSS